MTRFGLPVVLWSLAITIPALGQQGPADFPKDIQPLLKKRCLGCHGAQVQSSGLRLDSRSAALQGGYSGPAIVPGNSAGSRIIQMVSGMKKGVIMPPSGPKLTEREIALLRSWIDAGAVWPVSDATLSQSESEKKASPTHWSFVAPERPSVPEVRQKGWARNPIDAFILARLEKEGLTPSPEASRETLIRRVSFDLIGLPPTPEEVDAFVNDTRPDAYNRLVDRLLDSPHYGEKWARHWLDLGRYADSDGYEKDNVRPNAWRYRHWLIQALNRDIPFDEFTIETMAGDLLPHSTVDQKIATGFHRGTLTNREGGTDPEQFRYEQVLDRTMNLGTVWLGLTVGCAQCHDHKYDPISQKDFYRLMAFFDNADESYVDAPLPGEIGPYLAALPEYQRTRAALLAEYQVLPQQVEWEAKLKEARAHPGTSVDWDFALNVFRVLEDHAYRLLDLGPEGRDERQNEQVTDHFIRYANAAYPKEKYEQMRFKELWEKIEKLEEKLPRLSLAPILVASPGKRTTWIRIRGDYREHGIEVQPGTLSALPPMPAGVPPTRLALAKWLLSAENPLVARVTVNRMWQELFGRGIVRTSEDFGRQGEPPSHPQLLDWLAVEFREGRWGMKRMHRMIVESATYRQSSDARPELLTQDPSNVLLARQSRIRLPAEEIRDAALSASGLINLEIGGPSIRPPQPEGVSTLGYANSGKWAVSPGAERYRRGLYIHFQRTTPYPFLMNFDAPDSNTTCSRRLRSNTPLQALNLLNDPVYFEASQALARRLMLEAKGPLTERLNYGVRLCLSRDATPKEKDLLAGYFQRQKRIFEQDPKSAGTVFPALMEGVSPVEAATWTTVSRALLNLDEFLNRE